MENKRWDEARPLIDQLIIATTPEDVSAIETVVGMTRDEAETVIIERTNWGTHTFPNLQGGRGTFAERHQALLDKWEEWKSLDD